MLSFAMLRHFFFLRMTGKNPVACITFFAARGGTAISRTGKKVGDAVKRWVLMDAKCSQSSLELPTKLPISEKGWYFEKITDPSLTSFVNKMEDLRSEKLTGAMFNKEFLRQRIASLQDCSRPLWKLGGIDDKIRLRQDTRP